MDVIMQVPYHRPSIGVEEIEEVVATLQSGWLTTGPKTALFESRFAEYARVPHALAVNSCTAGLHLSLAALGLGPGDEVITTPLTFCATVNVIFHTGATPVLADVGADGNIDPASVAERITPRTRALMPVHLAGLPCDMEALWALAEKHGLRVVEDCAHAAGSFYNAEPAGSSPRSASSVFSFYATKNLTTGEGGMVTTHDAALMERMRLLCLHGISKSAWNRYSDRGNWYYEVEAPGFKYNLTDIQASLGIHQLRKLDSFIETRAAYAAVYDRRFEQYEELEIPPRRAGCRHAWHLYALRLNFDKLEIGRGEFINALRARGVGSSVHFIPIPLHPFFAAYAARPQNQCPRALALYPRMVSLPLYPGLTEAQVDHVATSVVEIVESSRKRTWGPAAAGATL